MALLRISFVIDEDELGDTVRSIRDIADTTQITITSADDDEPEGRISARKVRDVFLGTANAGGHPKRNRRPQASKAAAKRAGGKLAVQHMVGIVRSKKDGIAPADLHQRMTDAGFSKQVSYNSAYLAQSQSLIKRRSGDGFFVIGKGDVEKEAS